MDRNWLSRARAERNGQGMGHSQTARIFRRRGHPAEIFYPIIPTSEQMFRSIGKELQTSSEESYWGTSVDTV